MKKVVTILVIVVLVLALGVAGMLGFNWFRENHVFVDGDPYPLNAESLDLREEDISFHYHNELQAKLPDCYILWNVPFQNGKVPSDSQTITITALNSDDLGILTVFFPNLKVVDALGADHTLDYGQMELLMESMPDLEVKYQVYLDTGNHAVPPDTTELLLENGEYDYDTLMTNFAYLHELQTVNFKVPQLSLAQIEDMKAAYPQIAISCSVEILGKEYDNQTTELDLTTLTADRVAEVIEKLHLLPNLTKVALSDAEGSSPLTKEEVKTLMAAAPNVAFDYKFDFFGTTISTADEEVVLKNINIGDENEAEVRLTLDLLTNCKRFVLDNCKLSDEVMEKIRNDYRGQTKVIWRVWFGGGSSLTDAEIIRCTYDLVDDNCHDLYYCEDVRFVDFGHNEWLDSCDFVAGMTSLEYCILSGAPIKSLEPFANCKNLKFLEIAFCEYIEDLSPLKNCKNLRMLNVSNTHGLDLSPLDDLPLTHFTHRTNPSGKSRVSADEQSRFLAQHPDCWTSFDGAQPYGVGWRYGEDEITPLPQYALVQEVFRLPHAPNNTGWYLSEEALTMIDAMEKAFADSAVASGTDVPEETAPEETPPDETLPDETTTAETVPETTAEE